MCNNSEIMDNIKIRPLRADEIDVRIGQEKKENNVGVAASFLLYKDARCDMRILDELFTPFGWQREHKELKGTIYCGVSVRDENGEWVAKWDAGSESNVEKEKGEASDSFKRACFNWGIGIELYTAPFIWVKYKQGENGRNISLRVQELDVSANKQITKLTIVDKNGNVRYQWQQQPAQQPAQQPQPATAPQQSPVRYSDVLDAVRAANTVEELSSIWKQNAGLIEKNIPMREAFTKRKNEIQNMQQ